MAQFLVNSADEALRACKDKLIQLSAILPVLEEYRKTILVLLLVEYIMIKNGDLGRVEGEYCYIKYGAVIERYDKECRDSLGRIFNARDYLCHIYGSELYKESWDSIWNDDHVKKILECEGFL